MGVALVVIAVLALVALFWHAVIFAPGDVRLTVHDVPIPGLPPRFDGYRIAILTDFHHGPQQPGHRAAKAVAFANSQAPDLAVLLGDFGTSEWGVRGLSRRYYHRVFDELGPILRDLRAEEGIVAVIGNHDYYADADATAAWLEALGVRVLRGEAIELPSDEGPLRLVGIDDLHEGDVTAMSVAALLDNPSPTIVLSHNPDAVTFCRHPSVHLVLSGHTHGGQVVIPWIGAPVTRSEICTRLHPAGWVPNPYARLFVSRGVGAQIPIRFGAPPEVVVLTLRTQGE
jgi:uncharacterized protein